ncbi:unnamed protein product [Urochloa decumbens]|uniref:Uncharacterized protein n=1 Tax=Urochloa decumbens TaxID=240449 RepID=A0ABC8XP56_9POAL
MMMRLPLPESFRFSLLLLTLVLAGLCHGRRIPGAEVAVMAHDVESPPRPSEGHYYYLLSKQQQQQQQQRSRSRWRRLQDFSESKRKVPSGPNPLHN